MSDLISRQAAIDAIQRERDFLIKRGLNGAEHILTHHAYNIIADLPSTQPEIIQCKECRYYGESLPDVDTRMICHKTALNYKPDDFCSYAERRTDETD